MFEGYKMYIVWCMFLLVVIGTIVLNIIEYKQRNKDGEA